MLSTKIGTPGDRRLTFGKHMAYIYLKSSLFTILTSSVARGGEANGAIASTMGLKSMRNSMFFAFFRLIFALKTKIAPPNEIGVRAGEDPEVMSTRGSGPQCT